LLKPVKGGGHMMDAGEVVAIATYGGDANSEGPGGAIT